MRPQIFSCDLVHDLAGCFYSVNSLQKADVGERSACAGMSVHTYRDCKSQ